MCSVASGVGLGKPYLAENADESFDLDGAAIHPDLPVLRHLDANRLRPRLRPAARERRHQTGAHTAPVRGRAFDPGDHVVSKRAVAEPKADKKLARSSLFSAKTAGVREPGPRDRPISFQERTLRRSPRSPR